MLMFSAILHSLLYWSVNGAPLPPPFAPAHSASFLQKTTIPTDVYPRKTIEIIWSCVATILAASWVSVHPNLPHPEDSKINRTMRRVGLMFWAIITPEVIVFWAMRQWAGARSMEKRFLACLKEEKTGPETEANVRVDLDDLETKPDARTKIPGESIPWTRTHGFFLQMGGFMLHENGKEPRVIGWKKLLELYKAGHIDLSVITEARIKDHSKADGLAKSLALLQTFWFITQCIARFSDETFVLTELELVTAALAVLSLTISLLWWNKPFNAEIPIVITLSNPAQLSRPCADNPNPKLPVHKIEDNSLAKKLLLQSRYILGAIDHITNSNGTPFVFSVDIDNESTPVKKVPTFYSINFGSDIEAFQMLWTSFFVASLFGAIHCAGWSKKMVFSTYTTSLLWKIPSSIITCCPIIWSLWIFFGYRASRKIGKGTRSRKVYHILRRVFRPISVYTVPLYVASRIILLVISLVELRHIPPGALATIEWANVVPFIH